MSKPALNVVPNSPPSAAKKARVRAIDKGTRYDISGNLRLMAREIEQGKWDQLTDAVVLMKVNGQDRATGVAMRHWGTGSRPDLHWMLSVAKNRVEPA